ARPEFRHQSPKSGCRRRRCGPRHASRCGLVGAAKTGSARKELRKKPGPRRLQNVAPFYCICPMSLDRMKYAFALVCAALLSAFDASAQSWVPQTSGTTASFRGIHAVSAQTVWVSGTGGTYLITMDGGATWRAGKVPGAERLDFRAVWAFDDKTAYVLS